MNLFRPSACLFLLAPILARSEVKPSALFSDNAVLQQGVPVPVWGTARDGEEIVVTFAGKAATTTAKGGRWSVTLPELPAGASGELVVKGDNTVVARNVVTGEVWLCSGQSNMARTVVPPESVQPRRPYWEESAATADYPAIRHFRTGGGALDEPAAEITGKWEICTPQTVREFSAVGYFFAKDLHIARGAPVGLINSSVGATGAASWLGRPAMEADPMLKRILDRQDKSKAEYPALAAKYQADEPRLLAEYETALAKAKSEGAKEPRKPTPPRNPFTDAYRPAGYYNSKIFPLAPYAIRGVLWYQGESNSGHAVEYRVLFGALIADWRALWNNPALPFLFVQLPEYKNTPPDFRETQRVVERDTPATGMVVTIDCGDANDIHPPDKRPVGARLALLARERVYGEKITGSGPLFDAIRVEGGKAVLTFRHVGGGLVAKQEALQGFEIAGADKKFVPAEAVIVGEAVVVSAPGVAQPRMVRYAWQNVPMTSLYNREGLPASPFLVTQP